MIILCELAFMLCCYEPAGYSVKFKGRCYEPDLTNRALQSAVRMCII